MILNEKDQQLLKSYEITESKLSEQLANFKNGFEAAKLVKAATVDDGIIRLDNSLLQKYIDLWEQNKNEYKIIKFVPASGAASRMFKDLFEFKTSYKGETEQYKQLSENKEFGSMYYFFKHLDEFPFWQKLKEKYVQNDACVEEDLVKKEFAKVLGFILDEKGLNFGFLPKGLIQFHQYPTEIRKAFDEHFVEAANYASSNNLANLHFTVSPEHQSLFEEQYAKVKEKFEKKYNISYNVNFSNQKHSTDTVAVTLENEIVRNENNEILFRPGGHGALIQNLNNIDSDIIFIKNIDNVGPDRLKELTTDYKKALAGILLFFKNKIHTYIEQLEQFETLEDCHMDEIGNFLEKNLCILPSQNFKPKNRLGRIKYLYKKLNRPIRVCGMVKNEGEPGGGPFWTENNDGTVSLQIIESAQMDIKDNNIAEIVNSATHFNPVDIVCYVKNYEGIKFDLNKYVDSKTGFIAEKTSGAKKLKAMELPGLWNGAMADWITIFMETPIESFTPVKTVQDLLREQHK